MNKKRIVLYVALAIIFLSITTFIIQPFSGYSRYAIDRHIDQQLQDTLLVNIVTYMGHRPPFTDHLTRLDAEHRSFYIAQAQDYEFYKYYVDNDNRHFFYIIRPARHALGNTRAVGGWMYINEGADILQYQEVFVTRVLEMDSLKALAPRLFEKLINRDFHLLDHTHPSIEWPDGRLLFHPEKREWRYDVVN